MVNLSKIGVNLAFFLEKIDKKMEYLRFCSIDFVFNIFPGLVCHFWSGWRGKLRSWSYRDWEIIFLTNWFLNSIFYQFYWEKKPGLRLFWKNLPFFVKNVDFSFWSTYSTIRYHISMESRGNLDFEKNVKIRNR